MSWWNPLSWLRPRDGDFRWGGMLVPTEAPPIPPVATFTPKPAPPPKPELTEEEMAERDLPIRAGPDEIRVTAFGGSGHITFNVAGAQYFVLRLERALAAAEVMRGEHDDLLDDELEKPKDDAACGEGGAS